MQALSRQKRASKAGMEWMRGDYRRASSNQYGAEEITDSQGDAKRHASDA